MTDAQPAESSKQIRRPVCRECKRPVGVVAFKFPNGTRECASCWLKMEEPKNGTE